MNGDDPFRTLGLPARPDLSDDEVRAAWRRIAAATHPDLPGGGDAARFAAAAAAYATLRTAYGRGEAYAARRGVPSSTASSPAPPASAIPAPCATAASALWVPRLTWRMRNGRPAVLLLRLLIAAAVCWASVAAAGWQPATLAITVGVLTWLTRTARYDLAPLTG